MKHLFLIPILFLLGFQQPKSTKNTDRVYFAKDEITYLEISPIDKKTKSSDILMNFVTKINSGNGSVILRGCTNFDEENKLDLISKRVNEVKVQLIKMGASEKGIIIETGSKIDLTTKSKTAIDTIKNETKKELWKAHNRFVEIKFLKRS